MFVIPDQESSGGSAISALPSCSNHETSLPAMLAYKLLRLESSSLPFATKSFSPGGRLLPSSNQDRLVDVCEELATPSAIILPHFELLKDRYSERTEMTAKGRLYSQAEKDDEDKEKEDANCSGLICARERGVEFYPGLCC